MRGRTTPPQVSAAVRLLEDSYCVTGDAATYTIFVSSKMLPTDKWICSSSFKPTEIQLHVDCGCNHGGCVVLLNFQVFPRTLHKPKRPLLIIAAETKWRKRLQQPNLTAVSPSERDVHRTSSLSENATAELLLMIFQVV